MLTVGAWGTQSALGLSKKPKIQRWRGTVSPVELPGGHTTTVLPTVHPAHVMRAPQWGPALEIDVARLGRVLREAWAGPPEEREGHHIVIARDRATLHAELAQLLPGAPIGFDVETVGLGPTQTALVCFALSDGARTIVVPWSRSRDGTSPWWNGCASKVADAVSDALSTRITITHNGPAFDHIVAARYGIRIAAWDDTMLAAHVLASHMPKDLGHVVTMRHDVGPWKELEDRTADLPRLWVYNARDTLYTLMAWTHSITTAPPLSAATRKAIR